GLDPPRTGNARKIADIAGKSNGCTRLRRETRNNVTSQFANGCRPPCHYLPRIAAGLSWLLMNLKRRIPLVRWSVLRMAVGTRSVLTTGQVGDGREAAAVEYVLTHARPGDIDDVLATIDRFAYEKSMLINVGDEKGA